MKHKPTRIKINKAPIGAKTYEVCPTVSQYWPVFWRHHVCDVGDNKSAERDKKRQVFNGFIAPMLGDFRLDELNQQVIAEFRARNVESGVAKGTVKNRLAILRTFLNYAARQGVIEQAPRIETGKGDGPEEVRHLTVPQCNRLLKVAKRHDTVWWAMIQFAIHTGCRNGELRALEWSKVNLSRDPDKCTVRIDAGDYYGEKQTPKTKASKRTIHLNEQAVEALRALPRVSKYVFCRPLTGEQYRYHVTRDALLKIVDEAGLSWVTWHVFRHTFASHLVMEGVPLTTVKDLMGHTNITMTLRYAHLCPENRSRAVAILSEKMKSVDSWEEEPKNKKTNQTSTLSYDAA